MRVGRQEENSSLAALQVLIGPWLPPPPMGGCRGGTGKMAGNWRVLHVIIVPAGWPAGQGKTIN